MQALVGTVPALRHASTSTRGRASRARCDRGKSECRQDSGCEHEQESFAGRGHGRGTTPHRARRPVAGTKNSGRETATA